MLTCSRRATEVNSDCRAHAPLKAIQVGPVENALLHRSKQPLEVGATKVGAGLQLGKRIHLGTDAVEDDVLCCVHVEFLGQVRVDLQELDA